MGAERAFQRRLQAMAPGLGVDVAELPAMHRRVGDHAARLRVELVQVGEEALGDLLVGLPHQRRRGGAAGEQHQAAARAALGDSPRSAWAWLVNMSNARPGVAIA